MRRVRSLTRSFATMINCSQRCKLSSFFFLFSYFTTETRLLKLAGPWSYRTVRAPLCVCVRV